MLTILNMRVVGGSSPGAYRMEPSHIASFSSDSSRESCQGSEDHSLRIHGIVNGCYWGVLLSIVS